MARKPRITEARRVEKLREGDRLVADMVQRTLDVLREDARDQFEKLLAQYRDTATAIGVFGVGSVTLAVLDDEARVNPPAERLRAVQGRMAIYPETLQAITEGRMTVLDAFHRGELVARANSDDLHRAYDSFTEVSETAFRSPKMREVLAQFSRELQRRAVAD